MESAKGESVKKFSTTQGCITLVCNLRRLENFNSSRWWDARRNFKKALALSGEAQIEQGVMKLDEFYSGRDEAGRSVSQKSCRRMQEKAAGGCRRKLQEDAENLQKRCREVQRVSS
ncbi:hypothetical protein YC2023_001156 [Brassica napus]